MICGFDSQLGLEGQKPEHRPDKKKNLDRSYLGFRPQRAVQKLKGIGSNSCYLHNQEKLQDFK